MFSPFTPLYALNNLINFLIRHLEKEISDDMPLRSQFLPEQHRLRKRTRRRKNGGKRIKFSFSNSSAADSQGETPPESSVQGNDDEDAVAELLSPGPNPAEDFDENQDLGFQSSALSILIFSSFQVRLGWSKKALSKQFASKQA
eukprot:g73126.t1